MSTARGCEHGPRECGQCRGFRITSGARRAWPIDEIRDAELAKYTAIIQTSPLLAPYIGEIRQVWLAGWDACRAETWVTRKTR